MLCLLPCAGRAETQFAIGSIIRGFEVPQTDSHGKLRSKIRGKEALVMSANQIHIKDLVIEVYNDNEQIDTSIRSDECTYWKMENKLTTDKDIEVHRQGMVIKADGMEWELGDAKGIFRKNVKVILQPGVFNP